MSLLLSSARHRLSRARLAVAATTQKKRGPSNRSGTTNTRMVLVFLIILVAANIEQIQCFSYRTTSYSSMVATRLIPGRVYHDGRKKPTSCHRSQRDLLVLQQTTTDRPTKSQPQWQPAVADVEIPKTLTSALHVFFFSGFNGPRWIVLSLISLCAWRLSMMPDIPLSGMDALLCMGAVVLWWFQEHFLHGHLLHSTFDWYGRRVHEIHHAKPYYHISLDPAPLMVGWLLMAHVILFRSWLPVPWSISATLGYATAGLFYEWAHFIVHTKVPFPRGTYWRGMKEHHIKHHLVDSRNWLGFSVPSIDTLFHTNPNVKDVTNHPPRPHG